MGDRLGYARQRLFLPPNVGCMWSPSCSEASKTRWIHNFPMQNHSPNTALFPTTPRNKKTPESPVAALLVGVMWPHTLNNLSRFRLHLHPNHGQPASQETPSYGSPLHPLSNRDKAGPSQLLNSQEPSQTAPSTLTDPK